MHSSQLYSTRNDHAIALAPAIERLELQARGAYAVELAKLAAANPSPAPSPQKAPSKPRKGHRRGRR